MNHAIDLMAREVTFVNLGKGSAGALYQGP
jgi:hypothetical protein